MKIKSLQLENIRSYESEKIDFPDGSLLLSGNIGSGKSTVLLAIEYALFGLQPGQRGSTLLRNDSNYGSVSLELEVDGLTIILERKLKRSSRGVTNDYASIEVDGKKEELSVTEIKTKVLSYLGYPSDFIKKNNLLFRYTVFTPQEQMKQIILEDSETRLNIIRHIFGIDKYKKIRENLSYILINLKDEIKFLQGETKDLESFKENLEKRKNKLEESKKALSKLDGLLKEKKIESSEIEKKLSDIELKVSEIRKIESEIEKTQVIIRERSENFSNLNKEISNIKAFLSKEDSFSSEEYEKIVSNLSRIQSELSDEEKSLININSDISSLEKTQESNLSKKSRIFKIDICPTCLQDVSETHKHNILNETDSVLSETKKALSDLESEKSKVLSNISLLKEKQSDLLEEQRIQEIKKSRTEVIESSKERLSTLEKTASFLEKDIDLLRKHLDSLTQTRAESGKYKSALERQKEDLRSSRLEERNLEISMAETKKEIEISENEIKLLESKILEKQKEKSKLSKLIELRSWLSTKFSNLIEFMERNILMNIRKEFSISFRRWFMSLVDQESFEVQLDESFSPIIIHSGIEMEYSSLSGGERTSVALAYRLALNQTINSITSSIKTNELVILDEPTDGFSEEQIDKIRDLLSELNVSQLIIVSHERKIESFVDNVIRIKKNNDSSFIESKNLSPTQEP